MRILIDEMYKECNISKIIFNFCQEHFINHNSVQGVTIVRRNEQEMIVQFQADNNDITLYFASDTWGYYLSDHVITPSSIGFDEWDYVDDLMVVKY